MKALKDQWNDFPRSALGCNYSAANPHLEHQENFKVFHKTNDIVPVSLDEF